MSRRTKTPPGPVSWITPAKAKNLVGVAKVLGPAVLPVVAPYLARAATLTRDGLDRFRARRLGVPVEDLAEFTGRGGSLHARIVGADTALLALGDRPEVTEADREYIANGRRLLANLAAAVRAAERMPARRRKEAHRAADIELDRLEGELLHRLGV